MWDWTKIDAGARVTILQNIDVTVEYSYHDIEASQQNRSRRVLDHPAVPLPLVATKSNDPARGYSPSGTTQVTRGPTDSG